MIVSTSSFILETRLPNNDNNIGGSDLLFRRASEHYNMMINKHEPEYLCKLFGKRFSDEVNDYIYLPDDKKTNENLNNFIKIIHDPCRDYIFCKIIENLNTKFEGSISSKKDSENSTEWSNKERYIMIWNRMVDKNIIIYKNKCNLLKNINYICIDFCNELLVKVNVFDL